MHAVYNKETGAISCMVDVPEPELCCEEGECCTLCDESVSDLTHYIVNGKPVLKEKLIIHDLEVRVGETFTIKFPEPAFCKIKAFGLETAYDVDDGILESSSETAGVIYIEVEMPHYVCDPIMVSIRNES